MKSTHFVNRCELLLYTLSGENSIRKIGQKADCWIAFCGRIVMRPYDHFCGATVGAIHESPVSLPGPFVLRNVQVSP